MTSLFTRPAVRACILALVLVAGSGLLTAVLGPRGAPSVVPYLVATAVTAWIGGWGPGLFALTISVIEALLQAWYLGRPMPLHRPDEAGRLLISIGGGLGILWLVISLRDTQARLLQQRDSARESRQELEAILNRIGDAFIAVDQNWSVTFMNERATQVLQRPPAPWNSAPSIWDLFPDWVGTPWEQEFRRAMLEQTPAVFQIEAEGGRWRGVRVYPAPRGLSVYILDVTEERQSRERLTREREELSRSNEELDQFAYAASHDLQEPLRNILVAARDLRQSAESPLTPSQAEAVAVLEREAGRMKDLIQALLTYSRVVHAREDASERSDCNAVVQWTLMNLHTALRESGAVVTYDPLPIVSGNDTQLALLFQNLLSNAVKYRSGEPPRIHIAAHCSGEEWEFAVQDNGIGIDPADAERVFGIFQRLHGKEVPGTGIGLAICRRIVERHHGRIWVDSARGSGATFRFTLPAD